MDKKNLIIILVVALVSVIVGGALGMFLQSAKDAPAILTAEKLQPVVKSLSSKVVPSIMAFGQVEKIDGRKITITYNKETLEVPFKDSAIIYTFNPPTTTSKTDKPGQIKVSFSEIKVGDNLSVTVKLLPEGVISGESAVILKKAK